MDQTGQDDKVAEAEQTPTTINDRRSIVVIIAVLGIAIIVIIGLLSMNYRQAGSSAPAVAQTSCPDFTQRYLRTNDTTISVAIAATSQEQSQGLSGCPEVPVGQGMYFVFEDSVATAFWMKGMLIPIDIVWINDGRITGIDHDVQPPDDLSIPDSQLTQYTPPGTIDAVLELAAGQTKELSLEVGQPISLNN